MIAARGSSQDERLFEIGTLLAVALTRLLSRKSSGFDGSCGESSLPFLPVQSGGPPIPENGEPQ
jgi:hypothetical protein